jgi:hypothetical protein
MDRLDREMKEVLDREDVPTDERLKLHEQALFRYRNVLDDYRTKPRPCCGTFASRKASTNVSHLCGLKYFLLRSTSLTKSTTLLP